MLRFPKPIIAAIDGAVFGMGMALALASDLVVSSSASRFELPAARFGLLSGLVTPLLAFRCGAGVAARLTLGAEIFDAVEAHRVGIVHQIVPADLIWAKAHDMASKISAGAPGSVQLAKRLLNEMVGESLLSQLVSGAASMATANSTEAAKEGLLAFSERRLPKFG
jgi:methylglutaconyl-CoA hydratase